MNPADLATLTAEQRASLSGRHHTLLRPLPIANYWRVSRCEYRNSPLGTTAGPSRFSPRARPTGEEPPFTLLYLAENLATALYETIVRDRFNLVPHRVLHPEDYLDRVAFDISSGSDTPLALLDLTGANAVTSGIPNDVIRYSKHNDGQHFAEYVHAHMPEVHGILYESRFTGDKSVAVFERGAHLLDDHGTHDLARELVHAALARFDIAVL